VLGAFVILNKSRRHATLQKTDIYIYIYISSKNSQSGKKLIRPNEGFKNLVSLRSKETWCTGNPQTPNAIKCVAPNGAKASRLQDL
jgi:hypothetical protein